MVARTRAAWAARARLDQTVNADRATSARTARRGILIGAFAPRGFGCAVSAPRVARPLYRRLLGLALEHYNVAWDYTLAIPRREWRMRLACAWPLLIGLATLAALAAHPDPLAVTAPIKIPRATVRALLTRSALTVWSDTALGADAARLRRRITL